ncbi:MAG TPA: bifunctional alpha,alpha-trehalose-phosphate synthase (UDP-forming)/trehalose-phosphatase [Candidatus Paceibacterota bacterium]|nr:bifunctional alpha,alpha-trehalose-phosphate synthase (UDP-forming)/trehalose-phosphatase [Verrucomicrobiota bacterium]HSA10765.1 bifunctional alpha,alpha-trehalose-phosphate synthase (UDP-forming)/trehalose-phosphatase [Candidatus Paceibacterota bacterium]
MRLVIVSNRLPFTATKADGNLQFTVSSGGLTTGVWSYLERGTAGFEERPEFVWLGWPGATVAPEDEPAVKAYAEQEFKALPVFLPEDQMDRFYHGFCNKTLWPLFHYFPDLTHYEEDYWEEYKQVNRVFAEATLKVLRPDDLLWVHDYQLMLVPGMVRERFPDLPIGFFLHIPFPSYEVFRLLPRSWRVEIVEGLLGASLVGFHTYDYTRDFLTSVLRSVGYEHQLGSLTLRERVVKVDTFPMGIDYERFARAAASPETDSRVAELRAKCVGQKVIFSVDRLDYTKGLINRLRGYDCFLKRNPQWHGKVVFVVSVAPSRIGVESYQAMKQELEQTVGRIIGAYGNVHWTPLVYQFRNVGFEELVPMYRACDVALITPVRDGMNLVAKEFVASRPDQTGVLILSEMAGAAKEMGEALIINPLHSGDFAQALEQALGMPVEEQVRRNRLLQDRLRRYNVVRWAEDFVQALVSTQKTEAARRARALSGRVLAEVIQQYRSAARRALLLDYDGTLVPFMEDPQLALPDQEVMDLLAALDAVAANEVIIVSGRPRRDLEEWFGALPVGLIAEHGVWLRPKGGEWRMLKVITTEWKERVRPILQVYVDRLPGALLEEKEFSLAWHYRRADPDQASRRARELLDALAGFTRNIDVQVLEGNKVLEVRSTGVSKGSAATEWLAGLGADFILAIGDDWTDEDLFRALPETAFSVRVGLANTAARYYLSTHTAVRRVLREVSLASQVTERAASNGQKP